MKTDRFILIVGIISILCSIFVLAVTVPECLDHNLVSFSKPIQEEQEETAPSEEIQDTPPTADAVVYIFPAVVPNSEPQSLPFTSETQAPNPEPEMEQEQPKTGDWTIVNKVDKQNTERKWIQPGLGAGHGYGSGV